MAVLRLSYIVSIEAPRQTLHCIVDLCKCPHAARPALNMLTQPTEHDELGAALGVRALIDLVLKAQALQVLIEVFKCLEHQVAQETFICNPIP
jgi:hypothetical protein